MFLGTYLVDNSISPGATELAPPPIDWMVSSPSIQPIGPVIEAGTLGNPAVDLGGGVDISGASAPGTLGLIGTYPSFSPYPVTLTPVSSPPSIRTISVPPMHALDISPSTAAPVSGGVHLDPTDSAASSGLSTGALVAIGVVALLVILNL